MTQGSYKQFCPVAMAAEILCTRWTVVLLRELMAGSARSSTRCAASCVRPRSRRCWRGPPRRAFARSRRRRARRRCCCVTPSRSWRVARQAGRRAPSPAELIERAWRHLLHNHAHDSAAGCGVDEAHDDVKARYRWAEQLAASARDGAAQLRIEPRRPAIGWSRSIRDRGQAVVTVEAHIPRALEGALVSVGPDGIAHAGAAARRRRRAAALRGRVRRRRARPVSRRARSDHPAVRQISHRHHRAARWRGHRAPRRGPGRRPVPPQKLAEDQKRSSAC